MYVEIFLNEELIGSSFLDASDPPMGVARGNFDPSPNYQPSAHAFEIDGGYNENGADLPFVVKAGGVFVECAGAGIQDYSASLGERHVEVLGIPYPEYEVRFGAYESYKAYWGRS
ncbi:hypothetical protein [Novosphingobium taihuense]|uniref:Uncharacterized protein n=1 Tax=Novosphingobium taihuense TaxID=260085 RepID=A0A7W7AGH0_9SPHN|nr:hypothetical protein [Novosphingobium taihuense]MBB4615810.1 hypothetical protein [Novosphingobium taihuense]TWH79200.1 hypothetical protein IQ25_04041 [Novosphingobium taihuense]